MLIILFNSICSVYSKLSIHYICIQMMDCCYSQSFRDVVITRIVARYTDSLARHMSKETPLKVPEGEGEGRLQSKLGGQVW